MKSYRHAALAAISVLASFATTTHAQTSIYSEQDKLIRADRTVGTLGADLFGDKVNFYNGTLEFTQTDVSIPGNNALPVSIGRRLVPGSEVRVPGLFADWDLDIPHMHGIFASGGQSVGGLGWSALSGSGRCTNYSAPANVNYQGAMWISDEFWHGNFMYLPGVGSQEILARAVGGFSPNPNVPSDGNSWPLVTKSMAAIRCITNQQGGGEGFLAVTPDGTQYRFDWLVSRTYPGLSKPSPLAAESLRAAPAGKPAANVSAVGAPQPNIMFGYNVPRQEVWILPTLVTDRYGNTVTYTYNPSIPWQLISITSSDGRAINLTYAPGTSTVTSIFDGTRTWRYAYGSDAAGGVLSAVTQPDGAAWQFQMGAFTRALPLTAGPSTCDGDATANLNAGLESGSMTHPSGAVGTFQTNGTVHGRSFVERQCRGDDNDGGGFAVYPRSIPSRSLVKKTISNPSLPTTEWSYSYSPVGASASWSSCTGNCPDTKTTDVTDSRGVLTRYEQRRDSKNKLYAPEVECIAKGKARTPYEFGVKVSVAVTAKEGLVVGMRSMPGNPYDGHTVDSQIEQIAILTGITPKIALVDRGYRGVEPAAPTRLLVSHTRRLPKRLKKLLKRRQVVEPMIGHMKADGLLDRNWLKGALGDAMHAILCGAGHNLRMILAHLRVLYAAFAAQLVLLLLITAPRQRSSHVGPERDRLASRRGRHVEKPKQFRRRPRSNLLKPSTLNGSRVGSCQSIAPSMGLPLMCTPLMCTPLRNNGKFSGLHAQCASPATTSWTLRA